MIAVRAMASDDVEAVVELQRSAIDGSIVTSLGRSFLQRFYEVALAHPSTRAFVAVDNCAIVGFVLASLDVHAFNSYARIRIVPALARSLVLRTSPRLLWRFLRSATEAAPAGQAFAELLLIAVNTTCRRRGIGRRLIAAIESAFAEQGIATYRVAVRGRLESRLGFYTGLHFEFEQERLVLGKPMTYFVKDLSPATAASGPTSR